MKAGPLGDASRLRGDATPALVAYWRDKRGPRPYPAWDDIELIDLWRVAANLSVNDVVDGGDDFLVRYWGSAVAEASAGDATGKSLKAFCRPNSDAGLVNFRRVVTDRAPVLSYRRFSFFEGREHVTWEAVHLPLGPDGGPVTQVISAFDFDCDIRDILDGDDGGREDTDREAAR